MSNCSRPGVLKDLQGRVLLGGELFIDECGDLLYEKHPVKKTSGSNGDEASGRKRIFQSGPIQGR